MSRTLPTILSRADVLAYIGGVSSDAELGKLEIVWRGTEAEIRRFCGHNIIQPVDSYTEFYPVSDWNVASDPLLDHNWVYPGGQFLVPGMGPVNAGHILVLRQGFVRSITTVHVDLVSRGGTDGDDFAAATLLDSSSYYLDIDETDPSSLNMSRSGFLIRKGGTWPSRRRTVKVVYVAGLTEAELDAEFSDIRLAIIEEVVDRFRTSSSSDLAPLKREKLGDWEAEYAVATDAVPHGLSDRLRRKLQPFVRYRLG